MMNWSYNRFFQTLANENRLKIVRFLAEEGPKNVSEVVKGTYLEQSDVSHNLGRLLSCHFVEVTPNGRQKIYRLNEETIKPLLALIDKHVKHYCVSCVECKRRFHSSRKVSLI